MTEPEKSRYKLRKLFLEDTPFLDVRAEVEYQKGAFPTSVNLPILNTGEREKVGLCYKESGHDEAVTLGHELVGGEVRQARIEAWRDFVASNDDAYLYCWRGGMRSALASEWLKESGVEIPLVPGGYKALRSLLLDELDAIVSESQFLMVGGATGSAKTELVNSLANGIDLEGHANHRGSGFGRRVTPQPSQASFENALIIDLLKSRTSNPGGVIVLENEGRNIGSVGLPKSLADKMAVSPLIVIDVPLETRVRQILEDYVLGMLAEFEAYSPEDGFRQFRGYLTASLGKIRKRLGNERHEKLYRIMLDSLDRHESSGDMGGHAAWIETLLVDYYDPMTDYQLAKTRDRIVFRGDYEQALAGIQRQLSVPH